MNPIRAWLTVLLVPCLCAGCSAARKAGEAGPAPPPGPAATKDEDTTARPGRADPAKGAAPEPIPEAPAAGSETREEAGPAEPPPPPPPPPAPEPPAPAELEARKAAEEVAGHRAAEEAKVVARPTASPPPPRNAGRARSKPGRSASKPKPSADLELGDDIDFGGRSGGLAGGGGAGRSAPRARAKPGRAAPPRGRERTAPVARKPKRSPPPTGSAAPDRSVRRKRPRRTVRAPALRAGRHDDNVQYNRFLAFLTENRSLIPYPVDVGERLVVRALDPAGKSLANCRVEVRSVGGKTLATSTTYADGRTHFFPRDAGGDGDGDVDYVVEARCGQQNRSGQLGRKGRRETEVRFTTARRVPDRVPVDIAVVLDTTGSMQSQIDRLRQTLQAIHYQLTQLPTRPDIRFSLVAYRDRKDKYVTQVTPFTADVDVFQRVLDRLDANGGGDTPEDLQSGLEQAMHALRWRPDALRLGFVIADAIPHTDYGQEYTYRSAMREALERGIKWTTVGAGGLGRKGEVIFRQIAQFSMGEYVFITRGPVGDHDGGVGEASHHVGTNYKTENLDQAIIRIVRRELSHLTDTPTDFDYSIVAKGTKTTAREDVLAPAVKEALRQLVDYSSLRLKERTPVAIAPVSVTDDAHKAVAGYLTDQLTLSASRHASFQVVERDLAQVVGELKLQLGDLFDGKRTVELGKLAGAELLIVAKLAVRGDDADLFAKLVRVETGEVLSVAKVHLLGGIIHGS